MDLFDENDLDAALDALGEDVTLAGQSVRGIYEGPFERVAAGGAGVESYDPRLTVKNSDAVALGVAHGTEAIVPDGPLYVVGIEPERRDGRGLTLLILSEDPA